MATSTTLLAVDVGGTEIKAALLGADAGQSDRLTVLGRVRRVTPHGADGTATASAVVGAVAELSTEFAAAAAVGVVVPGVVH
ncbi:MAG TPA: hypothetical protein VGD84_23715, partial [Pseudonocardiaceae bacterium]